MPLISLSTNIDTDAARITRESKMIARLMKVFWSQLGELLKGVIVETTLSGEDVEMKPFAPSIVTKEQIPWVQTGTLLTTLKAKPDTKNLNNASVSVFPSVRYGFILDKGIAKRGKTARLAKLEKQFWSNDNAINRKRERIRKRGEFWGPAKRREIEGELQALYRKGAELEGKIEAAMRGGELPPVPSRPWIGAIDDKRVDKILNDYILPFFDSVIESVSNLAFGGGFAPLHGWVKVEMKRMAAEAKEKIVQSVSQRIVKEKKDGD